LILALLCSSKTNPNRKVLRHSPQHDKFCMVQVSESARGNPLGASQGTREPWQMPAAAPDRGKGRHGMLPRDSSKEIHAYPDAAQRVGARRIEATAMFASGTADCVPRVRSRIGFLNQRLANVQPAGDAKRPSIGRIGANEHTASARSLPRCEKSSALLERNFSPASGPHLPCYDKTVLGVKQNFLVKFLAIRLLCQHVHCHRDRAMRAR